MRKPRAEQAGLFAEIPLNPLFDRPSGAIFDPGDPSYRYVLWRLWEWENPDFTFCDFILLNPSTADADFNDPTVRRLIAFARVWGYGGIVLTNLFALRSTDPAGLYSHPDPIGPRNDEVLLHWARAASRVVCGWGNHGEFLGRGRKVAKLLHEHGIPLTHLKRNKGGHPSHPLYQPSRAVPIDWEAFGS